VQVASGSADQQIRQYMQQFVPLRLQSHQLTGQLYAGSGDWPACEAEFRVATEKFPNEKAGWKMLQRALDIQGKKEEAGAILENKLIGDICCDIVYSTTRVFENRSWA
jgi:uncharacterized protein HemY